MPASASRRWRNPPATCVSTGRIRPAGTSSWSSPTLRRIEDTPADYLELMELLFETYSRQMEPMIEHVRRAVPLERTELRHPRTGDTVTYAEARRDETLARWAETAYRSTVRAHACDILRGYLPAATRTNVGLFGVGQAFEYLLSKFYSSDLAELRKLGAAIQRELDTMIPLVCEAGAAERLPLGDLQPNPRLGPGAGDRTGAGRAGRDVGGLRWAGRREDYRRHPVSPRDAPAVPVEGAGGAAAGRTGSRRCWTPT